MVPAIFLDRDGVIIENIPTYVRSWEDVLIYPGALEALRRAQTLPHKIILITNQSAVGRGLLSLEEAWEINRRLLEVIQDAGGRVDRVYMCPHAPEENCACRKPLPGLLLQASSELAIDLSKSVLVGDAISDLLAGQAAGIPRNILVRTGRGASQESSDYPPQLRSFEIFDDLTGAINSVIEGKPSDWLHSIPTGSDDAS